MIDMSFLCRFVKMSLSSQKFYKIHKVLTLNVSWEIYLLI